MLQQLRVASFRHIRKPPVLHSYFSTTPDSPKNDQPPTTLNLYQRVKATMGQYGKVAVVFHSSVYLLTLGGTFAAIHSGVDVEHYIHLLPASAAEIDPTASTMALAFILTATTGPARGALTIATAPFLARYKDKLVVKSRKKPAADSSAGATSQRTSSTENLPKSKN